MAAQIYSYFRSYESAKSKLGNLLRGRPSEYELHCSFQTMNGHLVEFCLRRRRGFGRKITLKDFERSHKRSREPFRDQLTFGGCLKSQ
jgi:hypothetical protein